MTNPSQYDPYGNPPPSYPQTYPPSTPYYPPQTGPIPPQTGPIAPQQPVYAQTYMQPIMAPVYLAQQTETSGWAIASLICSILGMGLLGVIFGHVGLSEIKRGAGRVTGHGLAMAGLIIGYIELGGAFLFGCFWFVIVLSAMGAGAGAAS